jgi:hypothetical protein
MGSSSTVTTHVTYSYESVDPKELAKAEDAEFD